MPHALCLKASQADYYEAVRLGRGHVAGRAVLGHVTGRAVRGGTSSDDICLGERCEEVLVLRSHSSLRHVAGRAVRGGPAIHLSAYTSVCLYIYPPHTSLLL